MTNVIGNIAQTVGNVLLGAARETLFQIILLVLPFLIAGLVLHLLQRLAQTKLQEKFGFGSLLVTGWLGTPVHELSHALLCLLFLHKIDEIALFKPDRNSGTMGYVRHSWNPSNPWAVLGNFFIGLAPLAGGAGALTLLIWIFYPTAAGAAIGGGGVMESVVKADVGAATASMASIVWGVLSTVFEPANFADWRLWVFMYAVLCVGSHLGPSPADYKGAGRGAAAFLIALFGVNVALIGAGVAPGAVMAFAARILSPVMALFAVALALNMVAAAVVVAVTAGMSLFKK